MSTATAAAKRRVVITGVGHISPLGSSNTELAEALSAGRSGIVRREGNAQPCIAGIASQFSGTIGDFGELEGSQKKAIRKGLKLMCRETQMAVAAAQLALADAAGADAFDPERVGVVLGSDYMLTLPDDYADAIRKCIDSDQGEFDYTQWGGEGLGDMQPLWMLKYLPNMPASHIAIYNDFRGPSNSLTMREASGLMAVGEAIRIIERGSADRMVAGATGTRVMPMQAIHALQTEQVAGFNNPEQLDAEPTTLSRPFDRNRSAMVCGEGAGMLVLESLDVAQQRGAKIYGEVIGYGASVATHNPGSAGNLTGRNEVAATGAMRAALSDAGKSASDIGHVNAEGLGTPLADRAEAAGIRAALGDQAETTPVIALKSYFGNLGAGSGMVEMMGSLFALKSGSLPATLNYDEPDPECAIHVSKQSGLPAGDTFLTINTTPQGQAAAVVITSVS